MLHCLDKYPLLSQNYTFSLKGSHNKLERKSISVMLFVFPYVKIRDPKSEYSSHVLY